MIISTPQVMSRLPSSSSWLFSIPAHSVRTPLHPISGLTHPTPPPNHHQCALVSSSSRCNNMYRVPWAHLALGHRVSSALGHRRHCTHTQEEAHSISFSLRGAHARTSMSSQCLFHLRSSVCVAWWTRARAQRHANIMRGAFEPYLLQMVRASPHHISYNHTHTHTHVL